MATNTWTYDAPSGVYKNHAISSELRFAAIAQTKFVQFATDINDYGGGQGASTTLVRVSNMSVPSDDSLDEQERIPEDEFSMSTQSVAVTERGRSVPYTNLRLQLDKFNIVNPIQRKLRDQMALRMDYVSATAMKSGMIKAIPDGIASLVFDTDGTPSTTALANLNVYHVAQIRDYMHSTLNIQPYVDGDYMCLASTKALRGIKLDPNWEKWNIYTNAEAKRNGEVGRIENCRFIEVNNTSALSGSKGSGSVLGEAVFFGDDPMVMASVLDPELRAKESEDYGRSKGVAWYGIYGFAQIWYDSATAGEARVVHVTSA